MGYSPSLWSDNISGKQLKHSDEPMHRMSPARQLLSAPDDDGIIVTHSSCFPSRSSGNDTLVNELPSERNVFSHFTAIGAHREHKSASPLQPGTQPSSPKSPGFCVFNLRSCKEAIADAPTRFRFPSPSDKTPRWQTTVTGGQIPSPMPVSSSVLPDIAAFPINRKENMSKSWLGPCSQLSTANTVSVANAAVRSEPCNCDFACACCREHIATDNTGGIASRPRYLPRREAFSSNQYSINQQPLAKLATGEVDDEEQADIVEEERSHFSDCSTDEEDDGEKVPSNARFFNSLGRVSQRSKTRLSWGNLFSKS